MKTEIVANPGPVAVKGISNPENLRHSAGTYRCVYQRGINVRAEPSALAAIVSGVDYGNCIKCTGKVEEVAGNQYAELADGHGWVVLSISGDPIFQRCDDEDEDVGGGNSSKAGTAAAPTLAELSDIPMGTIRVAPGPASVFLKDQSVNGYLAENSENSTPSSPAASNSNSAKYASASEAAAASPVTIAATNSSSKSPDGSEKKKPSGAIRNSLSKVISWASGKDKDKSKSSILEPSDDDDDYSYKSSSSTSASAYEQLRQASSNSLSSSKQQQPPPPPTTTSSSVAPVPAPPPPPSWPSSIMPAPPPPPSRPTSFMTDYPDTTASLGGDGGTRSVSPTTAAAFIVQQQELEEARKRIAELNKQADMAVVLEAERASLLMEHRREVDVLKFESLELKKLLAGDDRAKIVQDEFIRLYNEKLFVEKDMEKLHGAMAEMQANMDDLRLEMLQQREAHEMEKFSWKEKEQHYVNQAEASGAYGKAADEDREGFFAEAISRGRESRGRSHSRTRSPGGSAKAMRKARLPSPSFHHSRHGGKQEHDRDLTRSHSPSSFHEIKEGDYSNVEYAAYAYREDHRCKKSGYVPDFYAAEVGEPTTHITIKAADIQLEPDGSPTRARSPETRLLLASHKPNEEYNKHHVHKPIALRANPSAYPDKDDHLNSSAFSARKAQAEAADAERQYGDLHKLHKLHPGPKLRETIVFTSSDPSIFLKNQGMDKEHGHVTHHSKDSLNGRYKTDRLGHFAKYTKAAANRWHDLPEKARPQSRAHLRTFRFAGKGPISDTLGSNSKRSSGSS